MCKWKGVNVIEGEVCPDHTHMLLEIPPKIRASNYMGFLKGKSSLMIYESYEQMEFKYRNREFWRRGYDVNAVEKILRKERKTYENS